MIIPCCLRQGKIECQHACDLLGEAVEIQCKVVKINDSTFHSP